MADYPVLWSVIAFVLMGLVFVLAAMVAGRFVRPREPNSVKQSVYECGEEPIGPGWIQFDLRFYIVAVVFLVFDVEVALLYPWAVTFGAAHDWALRLGMSVMEVRAALLVDLAFFFGILLVGFAYLWKFGYLDWVRTTPTDGSQEPS